MNRKLASICAWITGICLGITLGLVLAALIGRRAERGEQLVIDCRYVGQARRATLLRDASGNMTFITDGHADASLGCPVRNGRFDASDPACNTMEKFLAHVNREGSDWRCKPDACEATEAAR